MKPIFFASPCCVFSNILSAYLRNDNNPNLATTAVIIGGIFNAIGDYVCVFVLDLGIYYLALQFGHVSILAATVIARVISSFYNFNMNRKLVFKSEEGYGKTMVRYYALCVVQMLVSAGLVTLVKGFIPGGAGVATVIKAVVDTCLFVISYQIQKHWVFKK